jgi:hypothetical protein
MSSYGYMPYYKPVVAAARTGLAAAAAAKDPYGLAPNNRSGPLGIGSGTGFAAPPRTAAPKPPTPAIAATDPRIAASLAANPYAAGAAGGLFAGNLAAPTAADVNHYDLATDPGLQQIQSLVGMSNEQAQAGALKQRQNLVLAYGDPGVAGAVLGADDPIAAAAAQNPTSTVAQLGQSRDRNLKTLDDQLNADNLDYSGYRINQEQQAGQDYQNALAQAAAGLNSNLDQVGSNLTAALSGNNGQLVQGINDASNRAAAAATSSGVDPGAIPPSGDPTDPANEAAAAAATPGGIPIPPVGGGAPAERSGGGLTNEAPSGLLNAVLGTAKAAPGMRSLQSAAAPTDALAQALAVANRKRLMQVPLG